MSSHLFCLTALFTSSPLPVGGSSRPGHPQCQTRCELWPPQWHWGICAPYWSYWACGQLGVGHFLLQWQESQCVQGPVDLAGWDQARGALLAREHGLRGQAAGQGQVTEQEVSQVIIIWGQRYSIIIVGLLKLISVTCTLNMPNWGSNSIYE